MKNKQKWILLAFVISALAFATIPIGHAFATVNDAATQLHKASLRVTTAQRLAAAKRAKSLKQTLVKQTITPGVPDYFGVPNWSNSPILAKFLDSLPGLGPTGANDLGQYMPIAVADTTSYPGTDYYEIGLVQYTQQMHFSLPPTELRGYVQLNDPANPVTRDGTGKIIAWPKPQYLGPLIVAQKNRPVRVKFTNLLPTGAGGNLFLPVDTSIMGAGMGPLGTSSPLGDVNYTQNRATLHLHGGLTPWISDGTPHQWITPAGEVTSYPKGVSAQNVPDMPNPGDGSQTFYWTNAQSARLMFYHDHAFGITRLNVYVGEAAGYLLTDPTEQALITAGTLPSIGIPLILQDKTFVDATKILTNDPTWVWGSTPGTPHTGDLWHPHVYMPNQNPADPGGVNAFGRWDYGPWVAPTWTVANPPVPISAASPTGPQQPGVPNVSTTMEAYMDTPVINGTAYPYLNVNPQAYRFRILNAANDRFWNLSLFVADPNVKSSDGRSNTEVHMVPAVAGNWPSNWPAPDNRDGGLPDPMSAGPPIIQIGTECGFLPAPVVWPNIPIGYDAFGRIAQHNLFLGCAERADVVIDFSQYAGKTLILYNDSPAAVPAGDPRVDYYTGDPDLTSIGGAAPTNVGFGPNTRTIMQIRVANTTPAAPFNTAALNATFTGPTGVFATSQDPILVPQDAYNSTYGGIFPSDKTAYPRIQDNSITFMPLGSTTPLTIPFKEKAIAEQFETSYGRMQAYLGVELPFSSPFKPTTIYYDYQDPTTEVLNTSATPLTPVLGDGTQIWRITHAGVDTHPMHFHLFNVQLIERVDWTGQIYPPEPNELGWKETIRMNFLQDAIVAIRPTTPPIPFGIPHSIRPLDPPNPLGMKTDFTGISATGTPVTVTNAMTDFDWEYVWHCHILSHEEFDMMRPMIFHPAATVKPDAPTGLTGSVTSAAPLTVTLHWIDPTPTATAMGNPKNEIEFRIFRSVNYGAYTLLEAALANATTATDTTILPGTAYGYKVAAYNSAGVSAVSNAIYISLPGAPTGVTAAGGVRVATVSFTLPANNGNAPITSYTVTSNPGGITASGAASPIVVTGLTNGTAYTFTVTAMNEVGKSPASAKSNTVTPGTTPGVPTAVTAVPGYALAAVSFTAPATGGSAITHYTVTSSPGGITATGTTTTVTVRGLTGGTSYIFTVTATNAIGTGAASAPSNSVKPYTILVPGAPTGVTAMAGTGQATVSFTAPTFVGGASITLYTVTSKPGGITATGSASPIVVSGLTHGTPYTFTVTAKNSAGTGAASKASNSVTPSG